MDGLLYITVSLFGILLCHLLSEGIYRTCRNNPIKNKIYAVCYIVCVMGFGAQHYGVCFENEMSNNWFFIISFDMNTPTDLIRMFGFLFFILTILTPPPSKLRLLYYVLFKRRKSKY